MAPYEMEQLDRDQAANIKWLAEINAEQEERFREERKARWRKKWDPIVAAAVANMIAQLHTGE